MNYRTKTQKLKFCTPMIKRVGPREELLQVANCSSVLYIIRSYQKMGKKRIDIREMVERLSQPNREDTDVEAVCDAIDFLEYIDDSYAKEKSFLVAELKKSDDDETLNFIICVLRIMNNTLVSLFYTSMF